MTQWSLAGEFWAFIVIVILMLYFYERRLAVNARDKLYRNCLWMSMLCIGLNVSSVVLLQYPEQVPGWLNILLNSAYFLAVVAACSMVAAFVFMMMMEHVYEKHCLRRAFTGLFVVNILYAAAVLWNIKSSILFYIDSAGIYHRGRLNGLGYAVLAVEIGMIYFCYIKNRPSVSKSMVKVICTIPPVTVLLCMFQALFPEIILNETAMAVANLVLFIGFLCVAVTDAMHSRRQIEQSGEPVEEYEVLTPLRSVGYIVIGIAGIIIGGNFVVDSATEIALSFGLSQTFIGLSIVALGTSLPELVTSMVAAKKGENDLALGNVVGSNIFNILLILGASASITPITVNAFAVWDTVILIAASFLVYVCAVSRKGLSKLEGLLFLLFYAGFFVYILTR